MGLVIAEAGKRISACLTEQAMQRDEVHASNQESLHLLQMAPALELKHTTQGRTTEYVIDPALA